MSNIEIVRKNIEIVRKSLGPVTAYKYAVQQGYTGTEQEFAALMASYATVAEEAEAAKDDAIDAKTAAEAAQTAAEAAQYAAQTAAEHSWVVLDAENYTRNTLLAATGLSSDLKTRLCSRYFSPGTVAQVRPRNGFRISLYAYTRSYEYIGIWNGTNFVKTTGANNWTTTGWIISELPQNYLYRILLAKTTDDDDFSTTGEECVNVEFLCAANDYVGDPVPITYEQNSDNKYIAADGVVGNLDGYHYTDLIEISNSVFYHFTFSFSNSTRYGFRIHAYDENGDWVSQILTESVNRGYNALFIVANPAVKYIRISLRADIIDAALYPAIGLTDVVLKSTPVSDFDNLKFGIAIPGSVGLTTANAVSRCVASYLEHNSEFVYKMFGESAVRRTGQSFINQNGKFQIDCSSFALLIEMGVDFDNSRYNLSNDSNKIGSMGYGFNPFWGKIFPWVSGKDDGTYTWHMCKAYAEMGCTTDIVDRDFSGVQPGDIVFWGSTVLSSTVGRYKRIRHCDVVIGKVGEKDAILADAGSVPITVHLASERNVNDDIAVVARLPLGIAPVNTLEVISDSPSEGITEKTVSLSHTYAKYTPFAAKITITQTSESGDVVIEDIYENILFQSSFNAGTEGKTYDIIARGFFARAISSLTVISTGADLVKVSINVPATVLEKS